MYDTVQCAGGAGSVPAAEAYAMAPPCRFHTVTDVLDDLPADVSAVCLGFSEIERLIGGALPRGAWTRGYWQTGTVARNNWLRHGFVAHLDRHRCSVTFTRRSSGVLALTEPRVPETE